MISRKSIEIKPNKTIVTDAKLNIKKPLNPQKIQNRISKENS